MASFNSLPLKAHSGFLEVEGGWRNWLSFTTSGAIGAAINWNMGFQFLNMDFVLNLNTCAFWLHIHSLSIHYHSWEYDMEKSFRK